MLHKLTITGLLATALMLGAGMILAIRPAPARVGAQTVNTPPFIVMDRFQHHYTATMNVNITVDLRDVADDREDGPKQLEWFVDAHTLDHANFGYLEPESKQILVFEPEVGYLGSDEVNIDVKDSGGLSARAAITLTWQSPMTLPAFPPVIRRDVLRGKTAGIGATVCYDLRDKADDPDHPATLLRWFATEYDAADMTVIGMGSRELCLKSVRKGFAGCIPATFVVRDPHGKSDQVRVSTCWRRTEVVLPMVVRGVGVRR